MPQKVLTNFDLEKMVETNDQWIVERTGISRRHIADENEITSDLALHASRRALEAAGLSASDLDMIIVATISPDQTMPSTACILQHKLGAKTIFAFDLSAACSGFVYGLTIADQFIKTGFCKHILVVGAEILSRYLNYKDRETCILFGDGAGAAVISRVTTTDPVLLASGPRVLGVSLHADGAHGELLVLPTGGSGLPLTQKVLDEGSHFLRMKGREIFKNAVRAMVQSGQEAIEQAALSVEEIDWVVPHQANLRIIEAVANNFKIPMQKVIINVQETGNTSGATIPIALDDAVRDGRIQRGQTILFTAFGAGLTSGSLLMRY